MVRGLRSQCLEGLGQVLVPRYSVPLPPVVGRIKRATSSGRCTAAVEPLHGLFRDRTQFAGLGIVCVYFEIHGFLRAWPFADRARPEWDGTDPSGESAASVSGVTTIGTQSSDPDGI